MPRITKICSIGLLLAAMGPGARAQTAKPPVTATIDATKMGAPISPYLYGQFLEHIGNLVDSKLWCEILEDRKFYYPIAARETNGSRRWAAIGPIRSVLMDSNKPLVGVHSPLVLLDTPGAHGIKQGGLSLIANSIYSGHITLAGDPSAH